MANPFFDRRQSPFTMGFSAFMVLLLLVLFAHPSASSAPRARLDHYLTVELASPAAASSSYNVFLLPHQLDESTLPAPVQARLGELRTLLKEPLTQVPRAQRRGIVYEIRTTLAAVRQKPLLELLARKGLTKVEPFYINASVYVYGVSKAMIEELVAEGDVVAEIRGDYPVATVAPLEERKGEPRQPARQKAPGELGWNIVHIGADKAWNITKGEGVVVAVVDTGVRLTHEALIGSYRGTLANGEFDHDYNWFDPHEFSRDPWWCTPGLCYPEECCMDTPFDPIGHGSHVTGTAVGAEHIGIGVAPGAKWVGAKGCRDGQCMTYGLTTSAQWVLCPTRLDGSDPDCSKGADIVSNSWGGVPDDDWYMEFTTAWRDAGMIPVFSQGNSGPKCEKLGSPGDYDHVIGVGAFDSDNSLADFSSRGPSSGNPGFGVIKPDISAPGVDINSAASYVGSTDDKRYSVNSGTSMAAPHISGVIALVISVNPNLSYNEVMDLLGKTSDKNVAAPDNGRQGEDVCGGRRYDELPSNHYGEGMVNAYQAVLGAGARK